MRPLNGYIELPLAVPVGALGDVTVELRDVSLADAPSTVLATVRLLSQPLAGGARLPFAMQAPEVPAGRSLALRVQIDGRNGHGRADGTLYVTTQHLPVPIAGAATALRAPVERVA